MLLDIIKKSTTSKYDGDKDKFLRKFEQLYQLEILRPSLNLITSKCKNGEVHFVIQPLKSWDRCSGHCQTQGFFGKVGGIFSRNTRHEIVIKTIESDIIMHEIAHAIEKASGVDINADFKIVLGLDINEIKARNLQVAPAVESVMRTELKSYKLQNHMEELWARYFELIAMSYEVGGFSRYQFKYEDIISYLKNTTNWIINYFNPSISKMIDDKVKNASKQLVENLEPYEKKWADDVKNTHYNFNSNGSKNWSSGTKSTNRWAGIGEAMVAIEETEKKKIGN